MSPAYSTLIVSPPFRRMRRCCVRCCMRLLVCLLFIYLLVCAIICYLDICRIAPAQIQHTSFVFPEQLSTLQKKHRNQTLHKSEHKSEDCGRNQVHAPVPGENDMAYKTQCDRRTLEEQEDGAGLCVGVVHVSTRSDACGLHFGGNRWKYTISESAPIPPRSRSRKSDSGLVIPQINSCRSAMTKRWHHLKNGATNVETLAVLTFTYYQIRGSM